MSEARSSRLAPYFEQVGHVTPFLEPTLSLADAGVFQELAGKGVVKSLAHGEGGTRIITTAYASGVLSGAAEIYDSDRDVAEVGFYGITTKAPDLNFTHSQITFARFKQSHRHAKIYNRYAVEVVDGQVVSSVRQVRMIRHLVQHAIDEMAGDLTEEIYDEQYKAYEVPMVPEDVARIGALVSQIMRRQAILESRH